MDTINLPGAWDTRKALETLALKNAMASMRGKPCPVATRVVARLEIMLAIETHKAA